MLGIGGGIFLVPLISVLLDVPIHVAIGTSLVAVVATAAAGANVYLGRGLTDLRLAVLLQAPTVIGAIAGGTIAVLLDARVLSLVFASVALYGAWTMGRPRRQHARDEHAAADEHAPSQGWFEVKGEYYDEKEGRSVPYRVRRLPFGLLMSTVGGLFSGLLGIGGGIVQVPVMILALQLPTKVAMATSNFMVGITALASAFVYFAGGFIDPLIAAPAALAVLAGASIGARVASQVDGRTLGKFFAALLAVLALRMLWGALAA